MIAVALAVIAGVVAVTCGIVADSNHTDSLTFLGLMVKTTAAQIFLAGAICTWALFAALWLLSAGIRRSRLRGLELRAMRAHRLGYGDDGGGAEVLVAPGVGLTVRAGTAGMAAPASGAGLAAGPSGAGTAVRPLGGPAGWRESAGLPGPGGWAGPVDMSGPAGWVGPVDMSGPTGWGGGASAGWVGPASAAAFRAPEAGRGGPYTRHGGDEPTLTDESYSADTARPGDAGATDVDWNPWR